MLPRKLGRSVVSVISPLALLMALAVVPEPPAPATGDAMYAAARAARSASAYPHYASYLTVVRYRRGTKPIARSWETVEDEHRRRVHARAISVEEQAHPTYPHGINVAILVFVINPPPKDDPIGQVTLAVDQDFGLALNTPPIAATTSASDVASTKGALPIIGRTGAIARVYEVTVLDDVDESGTMLHHLALRPLRDPHRNRLRELWVDAKTSLPIRAIVAGIGNRGPLDAVSWRVEFRQIGDGTYIARETALAPLDTSSGRLDDVTITFEDVRPTNVLVPYQQLALSESVGISDP